MSRSRRKQPFAGNTASHSEKWEKRFAHRRERRHVHQRICEEEALPDSRTFGDRCWWGKDGKARFDPEECPKAMRK